MICSAPSRFAAGKRALGALMAEAGPAWRRLAHDVGADDLYAETGHLVVWGSPQAAEAGRKAWAETDIGPARVGDLEPETLERLGARLKARPAGGVRFEGSGRILDLPALQERLKAALTDRGGLRIKGEVVRLSIEHGRAGVPLYLVYGSGGGDPVVLPQLLTPGGVAQAIRAAAKPHA